MEEINGKQAKIVVHGENGSEETTIKVLFNPESYEITYQTSYQDTPISGTDQVVTQFLHGNPSTLFVELFFDTSSKEYVDEKVSSTDVTEEVKKFIDLVYIKGALHRPPLVNFQWGSLNYPGFVTTVNTSFIEFEDSGKPVRANLKLYIKEYVSPNEASRKTPFESPDRTKIRQVTEGKNLWHIAYEEYGNMNLWKVIAARNDAVTPFDIADGQYIYIPAL